MNAQQLKNSILQRAIEGKLVEQRAGDGTTNELLNIIDRYNEKIRPIKDELNFSAMDFDIPETWEWVELNRILKFIDYRGKTPTKTDNGVFLITASNIKDGYMDYTRKEYISEQEYSTRQERGITELGDILFTTEAPMGNCAINDLERCSCGQRIITFKNYHKDILDLKLLMYFLLSPAFQRELLDNCTGTTAKGIKAAKLKHFKLPLPPLAEQHRIVAKIEELLPFIDKYDKAHTKLTTFNERFPEMMKKSILQYAIEGKLVEQRKEEGTADELLQQIQAEKKRLIEEKTIKKTKPLPPITEDEIPFDIPDNWTWVRLSMLGEVQTGNTPSKLHSEYFGNYIPFVSPGDIVSDVILYREDGLSEQGIQKGRWVEKDSILQVCIGGSIGKIAITTKKTAFNQQINSITPYCLDTKYLFYVLSSDMFTKSLRLRATGTATPIINKTLWGHSLVPLPPISEQHRIVAKIEELLPLCDRLIK